MRKASKATIVALALLFVSIWVVLAAGITAVWLTEEVRVFGLVILPTGIVAGLLVVYFDWRAKLRRRAWLSVTDIGPPRRTHEEGIMLYTNTAIEYRDGTLAAILPVALALAGRADDFSERQNRLAAERAIDDVLADSFPASDPPSWNPGVTRPEPVAPLRHRARSLRTDRGQYWTHARGDVIDVSRHTLGERTFIYALISFAGAVGVALLVPFAILMVGLPVALAVRGLPEAIGWLFGVVVR